MASASLVVRVAADLNDFTRQLHTMTKDVEKAASKIKDIGESLAIGITLPVGLATVAMAKMGLESVEVAGRLERSFGGATDEIKAQLERLRTVLPVTATETEQMAIRMNNFAKGLDMAAGPAAKLSGASLQMAADLAAFSGVPFEEALTGIEHALEGQTKGLKAMGVVITQTAVQQEAYRLNLLKTGETLTPLGTALATYSLLAKQSTHWTGEAGKLAQSASSQFRLLWRDVQDLADDLGTRLVPALQTLVGYLRAFLDLVKETPGWVVVTIGVLAGLAAAIGPLLIGLAMAAKAFTVVRAAMTLMTGVDIVAGIAGLLTPIGWVIAGVIAIGTAVAGVIWLWQKLHGEVAKTTGGAPGTGLKPPPAAGLGTPVDVKALMGGVTSEKPGTGLQQFEKAAGLLTAGFHAAEEAGRPLLEIFDQVVAKNQQALALFRAQHGALTEEAAVYDKIVRDTQAIITLIIAARSGNAPGAIRAASVAQTPQTSIALGLTQQAIAAETTLRTREAALRLKDSFDAVRVATIEYGEHLRRVDNELALREELVKKSLEGEQLVRTALVEFAEASKAATANLVKGIASFKAQFSGAGVLQGLQAGLTGMLSAIGPVALILVAFGKVLQPIMDALDRVLAPLTALGEMIVIELQPAFRILFEVLKALGIAGSIVDQVLLSVAAGIAHAIGGLIHAIGTMISKIPFLGGVGHAIQRAGDAIIGFGDSAQDMANEMAVARKKLIDMKWDDLASSANAVTSALTNVPSGFRVAYERYLATVPVSARPAGGGGGAGGGTGGGTGGGSGGSGGTGPGGDTGPTTVILTVDGTTLAKAVVQNLQRQSQTRFGTTLRWAEVMP